MRGELKHSLNATKKVDVSMNVCSTHANHGSLPTIELTSVYNNEDGRYHFLRYSMTVEEATCLIAKLERGILAVVPHGSTIESLKNHLNMR